VIYFVTADLIKFLFMSFSDILSATLAKIKSDKELMTIC